MRVVADAVIKHFEETEGNRKIIADLSEGSNVQMEQWIQSYRKLSGLDERMKMRADGIRRLVEARRRGRGSGTEQTTKILPFSQEEPTIEMDEKDVMAGVEEMRTGRGCMREDKCQTNETSADETNRKG